MRPVIGLAIFIPGAAVWGLGILMGFESQWLLCIALSLVGGFMVGAGGYLFMVKPR